MTEFIARQPIFNQKEHVYGYEILFRSSLENFFQSEDGEAASRIVADQVLSLGQTLTEGRLAFINCTADFLINDIALVLPPKKTVVEVLETVAAGREVIEACKRLKKAGYLIALDDFVWTKQTAPLTEFADFIKVDFLKTSELERKALLEEFGQAGIRMLAEKLEGREDFEQAVDLGYQYFQGHFFCRPKIMAGRRIPASKLNCLRIVEEVSKPEFEPGRIEEIICREVALSYKLLRYANSALFGFQTEIRSIRHALTLLGAQEAKKLISTIAAVSLGDGTPGELISTALLRAKCCEQVALKAGPPVHDCTAFLLGMFSVIDALLGLPMAEILAQVALPPETKGALLGEKSRLRDIYELVFAYEKGNWGAVNWYASNLRLDETMMPLIYFDSLDWAHLAFSVSSAA